MVIGLDVPVDVLPPGFEVTVYETMGLPPLEAGGVKMTIACAFPAIAATPVGAPGTVITSTGVTPLDGLEAGPIPTALVALTVKV